MKVVELEFSKSSQVKSSFQTPQFCHFFGKFGNCEFLNENQMFFANRSVKNCNFYKNFCTWRRKVRVLESIFRRFQFRIEQRQPVRSKQKFKAENSLGRFKFIIWKGQERNLLFKNTFGTYVGSKYSPGNSSGQYSILKYIE